MSHPGATLARIPYIMNVRQITQWLFSPPTTGPWSILFVRLMVGGVFLWEGIGKFYFASLGVGRFTLLGFPMPGVMSAGIGLLESVGGACLIAGLLTRPFAILFIGEMIGVLITTKVSLFLGQSPLPLPPVPPQFGMWAVLHEARSDYAQLMSSLFLLFAGPGTLALDAYLASRKQERPVESLVPNRVNV